MNQFGGLMSPLVDFTLVKIPKILVNLNQQGSSMRNEISWYY